MAYVEVIDYTFKIIITNFIQLNIITGKFAANVFPLSRLKVIMFFREKSTPKFFQLALFLLHRNHHCFSPMDRYRRKHPLYLLITKYCQIFLQGKKRVRLKNSNYAIENKKVGWKLLKCKVILIDILLSVLFASSLIGPFQ